MDMLSVQEAVDNLSDSGVEKRLFVSKTSAENYLDMIFKTEFQCPLLTIAALDMVGHSVQVNDATQSHAAKIAANSVGEKAGWTLLIIEGCGKEKRLIVGIE